jgi:hypothetical protein
LVASSHATTKDKKEGSFKFCFEYPLNPFKYSLTRATDTHNKRNNLPKLQFFKMIRIYIQSHTNLVKLAKLVFCKLVSFSGERWIDWK